MKETSTMANKSQAVILGCMAVSLTETLVGGVIGDVPHTSVIRTFIGGYVVTMGLLITSEMNPQFAESFAILILLASTFGPNGEPFLKFLSSSTVNPATYGAGDKNPKSPKPNTPL